MKRKIAGFLAMVLTATSLFTACGDSGEYIVPTYEENKSVCISTCNGSLGKMPEEMWQLIAEAGIDMFVGLKEEYVDQSVLDLAMDAGVQVITDCRGWNGQELEYQEHPAFAGCFVWDEPSYGHFEQLSQMSVQWKEKMEEELFFICLYPGWAGSPLGGSYDDYVKNYVEEVEPPVLCFDHYALMKSTSGNDVLVRDSFYSDMDIISHHAREADIPMWHALQSSGFASCITPNADDISWQFAIAMAYGAQGFQHYVWATHASDYTCPIDWKTRQPTEVYDAIKAASLELKQWDHIYMAFDWQGTDTVDGSNNSYQSIGFQLCQYDVEATEISCMETIESTEDLLCGVFTDDKGNEGFMITNATNPYEGKNANIKITFEEEYKGAMVIRDGVESIVDFEDGAYYLTLPSFEGVFVIPLKKG